MFSVASLTPKSIGGPNPVGKVIITIVSGWSDLFVTNLLQKRRGKAGTDEMFPAAENPIDVPKARNCGKINRWFEENVQEEGIVPAFLLPYLDSLHTFNYLAEVVWHR